eukprot:TRINITY_DN884_c0_g2_i2.p1 TRINITY_DN884_c0_g2~~TRINITY_DN884_c0_g2_i2.p1  ORF type:complete len:1105 (+),score=321.30 TRINITY_DN884_c0_g2_i2:101-3415(+)
MAAATRGRKDGRLGLAAGARVFWLHPVRGWSLGKLAKLDGAKATVTDDDTGDTATCPAENLHPRMDGAYDAQRHDLFEMNDLAACTLLFCVKERYERMRLMYTRMGEIVISLNPFERMPYNTPDAMKKYTEGQEEMPHCWEVAHKAYTAIIVRDRGNQSILISGESGAGKTETTKMLIDFLGAVSYRHSCNAVQRGVAEGVNAKLRASNPILESFGNAKTSRNDNSSRFGKYIKLFFDKRSGVITGAEMVHYLLEKSRIVSQNEGERGYHVFYELLAGAPAAQRERLGGLQTARDYTSLRRGGCFERRSASGEACDDAQEYRELCAAMTATGIEQEQQDVIWSVLAAILHLQNVVFGTDGGTGKATVTDDAPLATAARLLSVPLDGLRKCLLTKAETKIMTQMATESEAGDMRDALSKALYSGIFDWLVSKINDAIRPAAAADGGGSDPDGIRYIGLLDIFGFENFAKNSFEQFCINFTNETLQNHYNKYTFLHDAEECKREGIACPIVDYPDNGPCLAMLQGDGGVMPLLDNETNYKLGTDESFTQKAWEGWGQKSPFFVQPKSTVANSFSIRHYAATVVYDTGGWLEKNSDTLKDDMRQLIDESAEATGFVRRLLDSGARQGQPGKRPPTVSSKFRKQLEELKRELDSTESHFVRTVKPNPLAKPRKVDNAYVMAQLTCAGVMETIIMKRQGYPVRQTMRDFWGRYRWIMPREMKRKTGGAPPAEGDALKAACHGIAKLWVWVCGIPAPHYDVGHTKVFMKSRVADALEYWRHRRVAKLLPLCKPHLKRWVKRWRKKRKEQEERRRKAQEEIALRRERGEEVLAEFTRQAGAGMSDERKKWFNDLAGLFPTFDLPVIHDVVGQCAQKQQATAFLLDMQHQRVRDALPAAVIQVFSAAKLADASQEALIRKGLTRLEDLEMLSGQDLIRLGLSNAEIRQLRAALLAQEGSWVARQRHEYLVAGEPQQGGTTLRMRNPRWKAAGQRDRGICQPLTTPIVHDPRATGVEGEGRRPPSRTSHRSGGRTPQDERAHTPSDARQGAASRGGSPAGSAARQGQGAPAAAAEDEAVASLVSMGFEAGAARDALRRARMDRNVAISILVGE